ncbi:unnamed protein product, partial [Rotaria magnacalcarata]
MRLRIQPPALRPYVVVILATCAPQYTAVVTLDLVYYLDLNLQSVYCQ